MNKAYRLIWSKAKDAWAIVAEIVKGNGGPPPITVTALMMAAGFALAAVRADALPTGQQVVNGNATFTTSGNTLTITNSPNAIINWQGFSIAAGERTTFNQQNASSAVLNRVIGSYRSDIFGMLDSNGRVFLLNPNGILFGAGSQINVASLVASSLGMTNSDFISGNYRFSGNAGAGSVTNEGTITAAAGGKVWLIAPQVENRATGIITAPNGDVVLAAGQSVNMVDPNNPEVAVVVSAPTDKSLNLGIITAAAGKIGIFGSLVDQQGTISADSAVVGPGGRIFLKSTTATTLSVDSVTSANALESGDGGRMVVLSDGETTVAGKLSATGGLNGGDGGFIETSGAHVKIADDTHVTTLAPSGNTGTWLIDPNNFTIAAYGGDISGATLSGDLLTNNVVIKSSDGATVGNGDIFVSDLVSWSSSNHLTLQAERNIAVNSTISAPNGTLTLDAPGSTTQTAPITASKLELLKGNFTLTNTSNTIGTLAAGNAGAPVGDITLTSRNNLTIGSAGSSSGIYSTGTVKLDANVTSYGGSINGSFIKANWAVLTAANGIGTTTALKTEVSQLTASNTTSGDINISNTGSLTVKGITNNAGSINLDNIGGVTVAGDVNAENSLSRVVISAHSPLTINAGAQVTAGGLVNLVAGANGTLLDNMLVNGNVTSLLNDILLQAGNIITVNGRLSAPHGKITRQEFMNPLSLTQMASMLPGVRETINSGVGVMGNESTDLTEEDKEDETKLEGERHGIEFRALPYCN